LSLFLGADVTKRTVVDTSESKDAAEQQPTSPGGSSAESRRPLVLLPRSKPVSETESQVSDKNKSIFGTGKPRDINKPEIKELEERLEQTIIHNRQPPPQATPTTSTNEEQASLSSSAGSSSGVYQHERLRSDSNTSSIKSNQK
jgi:hypothetical protein